MNIHAWVRGKTHLSTWQSRFGIIFGHVDADILGYHWRVTMIVRNNPRRLTLMEGRCWEFRQARRAMMLAASFRKLLAFNPGPGIVSEFNFRKWFCDFTRMP